MAIKLIAIDIDGTLINDKHQITPEVHEALQKAREQGVKVVLCTGRPLPGVTNYLNELELFTGEDYVICYNGSLVQNTLTKEIIVEFGLTLDDYLEKWNISIYDERRNSGILKTVVIRQTLKTEQVQVVFVTVRNNCANLNQVVNEIISAYPQIVSVMQNINPSRSSLVWGEETFKLAGTDRLLEQLGDIKFELSARSFFQLNPSQTEVLYTEVKKALDLKEDETLVDAYCGVGTISLFVSPDAKEVRGMDIIPEAIEDAKKNAELSGRKNIHYEVGKAEDLFAKWTKNNFVPDALVVDPPRTGLDDKMIETILKYRPNKFVYVSCNPSTLARDLVKLVKIYNVEYIQSVDMFPQTARVEAVVKLSKK